MEHEIIPCVEGDDEFIADKLNAITDAKIDFEDTIEGQPPTNEFAGMKAGLKARKSSRG